MLAQSWRLGRLANCDEVGFLAMHTAIAFEPHTAACREFARQAICPDLPKW